LLKQGTTRKKKMAFRAFDRERTKRGPTMKTVFIGGGGGCLAVLEMINQQRLSVLSPEILGVVDPDPNAPGMVFAREQGWPTFARIEDAIYQDALELVIEVTGLDEVRDKISRLVPDRVRIMDHQMAQIFWDLDKMAQNLLAELNQKTKLEQDIREDRRRLQELLDSLPDSVMVLDQNGRIERVNRRFEEVTGLPWTEVEGLSCRDLFCRSGDKSEFNEDICPYMRVLKTGQSLTVEQQDSCIRGSCSGDECYYQITANPIRNNLGEPNVVVTSREITEQIRLARETEEQAERARQIMNTVNSAITITDLEGRLVFVNPSARKSFQLTDEDCLGKTMQEVFPPELFKIIEKNDEALLETDSHSSHEEVWFREGEKRVLKSERILLCNYKNEPVGICRVARDITTARRMHEELAESEKHAAVGKLAAGVAHELNNPLTGILTFSEDLLEDVPKDSPVYEDIAIIVRETLRCRRIVRDLLDFSRQAKTNLQVVSIEQIAKRALKLVEKQAAFQDIRFSLELGGSRLKVHADPNQLQQVILNLIINARDAMDGKGRLSIILREESDENQLFIDMVDEGCGISKEAMEHIFEPFYSTKGDRGNGLGLAVVRGIIQEHGGAIDVTSTLGAGTTFRITLPTVGSDEKTRRTMSSPPAYHDWTEN
jgi:two-component system NtrC family sensor kinase